VQKASKIETQSPNNTRAKARRNLKIQADRRFMYAKKNFAPLAPLREFIPTHSHFK
jgi:hypothetical protein